MILLKHNNGLNATFLVNYQVLAPGTFKYQYQNLNMAESDILFISMEQFERNVGLCWKELQIEMDLCDVTLACEDKQIKTHKVILYACSPVLRNILKMNPNQHPLIYLRRVKYKDLQNLLNFMYQGAVSYTHLTLPTKRIV